MRFPKRLRGLTLGMIALVAGPVIAVILTSTPGARSAPTAAVSATDLRAQQAERDVHLNLSALKPRIVPTPTPTPTPVPVPAATPRPAPQFAPPPAGHEDVVAIIRAAAAKWGVSGDWMVHIAQCESGLRPNAYNPHGPYYGLFQFLMSTFTHNGGTNIWDPSDQANTAAKMLAHGQAHQWSCA